MRKVLIALAAVMIAGLVGCKHDVHSVDWYDAHPNKRAERDAACDTLDPTTMSKEELQDCDNAGRSVDNADMNGAAPDLGSPVDFWKNY